MAVEYTNQREILVNAMQRSGHHAFIDWILKNQPGHLFLNCVADERFYRPRFIRSNPELRFVNDLNLDLDEELSGNLKLKELLLYNCENYSTDQALEIFNSPKKPRKIGTSKTQIFVVWLRDPFNNFASLAKRSATGPRIKNPENVKAAIENLSTARDLWIDHFRQFEAATKGETEFVPALYNRWLDDADARIELAQKFGISSDATADTIVKWGGGSSFTGYSEQESAPDKSSLEARWEELASNEIYVELFKHDDFRTACLDFLNIYESPQLRNAANRLL